MAEHRTILHASNEQHPWDEMSPSEVLAALPYELYGPVSSLGGQLDRLASEDFEEEDLAQILENIREATNQLSRLVIALKRYNAEQPPASE